MMQKCSNGSLFSIAKYRDVTPKKVCLQSFEHSLDDTLLTLMMVCVLFLEIR